MPRNNLSLRFKNWFEENLSACNACYANFQEITFLGVEDCACDDKDCWLVWCRPPNPDAAPGSCAEIRWLHQVQGISEQAIFSEDEVSDEIKDARRENQRRIEIAKLQLPLGL